MTETTGTQGSTVEIEQRGAAAWVWMNRPEFHNALNETMILELTEAFRALAEESAVRVIVLAGRGKSFSAGADVESMKRQGALSPVDNLANARELAEMFRMIAASPKPTVARVHGAAIGGGLGFVSVCDIALAANSAVFAAPEVRLGMIPATIGPYVVRALGTRWSKRLFLTGERIRAAQAERIGLVHSSFDDAELDAGLDAVIASLLTAAPGAQRAAKELVDAVAGQEITQELIEDTAVRIATIRAHEEAHEGISAFLEKRSASWVPHV